LIVGLLGPFLSGKELPRTGASLKMLVSLDCRIWAAWEEEEEEEEVVRGRGPARRV